jgi:signal transduction histidine kinase
MERAARIVLEMARSVLAELDLDVVLDRVLEAARAMTGARYAAVGVLDEAGTGLARFVTAGLDDDQRRAIGAPPAGRGVLGELIRRPEPLRLDVVGAHPVSFGFPLGHPPMETFLGVPVLVGGAVFGNLYLTEKAGGEPFTAADEEAATMLAELAGIAVDHARRYSGSEARRDELERTVAALDATTQIARALGGHTDLDRILELVAKRGRALVSARAVVIGLVRGSELVVASAAGRLAAPLEGRRLGLGDGLAVVAVRNGRTERLGDPLSRQRFAQDLGRLGVEAQAGLVVPLVYRGAVSGVLYALDRTQDGPAFSAEDVRLLEAFAASAATAVATAQNAAEQRDRQRLAAAEQERTRWARELHDETLQGLGALRIGLSAARRSGDRVVIDEALDFAVDMVAREIDNLRALITDLRPAALDELGIEAAIVSLADRARRQGLAVEVDVRLGYEQGTAPGRLAPELETAVYRLVQEALTNAIKHGGAAEAAVAVQEDEATVHLTVSDDGQGFDPAAATEGFGLLGMRERVDLLQGHLKVESAPGQGTTVRVDLPVQRRTIAAA